MEEFYWITRLDAITITLETILILCAMFGIVGIIAYFVFRTNAYDDEEVERVNKPACKKCRWHEYVPREDWYFDIGFHYCIRYHDAICRVRICDERNNNKKKST